MNKQVQSVRTVELFRDNGTQVITIPEEFELPRTVARMSKDGNRLIIERLPTTREEFNALLDSIEPVPEFPEYTEAEVPPRDVNLE